jgi:hypothetical protein
MLARRGHRRAVITSVKKTGTLQCMNISPKGTYEGFLLKSGKNVVQINLPEEHLHRFADGWPSAGKISVEVEAEDSWGAPAHKVFRLVRFMDNGSRRLEDGPHIRKDFSDRIERLNYALHGEVNGGILESGDFLHLKSEGARTINLEVGMAVEARGKTRPMPGGRFVIDADEVNGTVIGHHRAKKKHAK